MTGLRDADLASVSGQAIQSICSQCQDHLQGHLECLLNIAQAVDAFNLSGEAALGIIKGKWMVNLNCCIPCHATVDTKIINNG